MFGYTVRHKEVVAMGMPEMRWSHIGNVLELVRGDGPVTRAEVIERSGLSRSTVNQHLAALGAAGLVAETVPAESTGGRPSSRFVFDPSRGAVLALDIGATGMVVALCDLGGRVLRHRSREIEVWAGPEPVLEAAWEEARALLVEGAEEVWGISVGVPGPVEFAARRVINPPIMTGWDRFDIGGWFDARMEGVAVVVENDVNARAIAEARLSGLDNLIALKVGTGIGAGLFFNGAIIRGDKGDAGDIGHTRAGLRAAEPVVCRCGNEDCVEALAGGWALQRDLRDTGRDVSSTRGIVDLVRAGDHEALRRVRAAGRTLGDAIADLVGILNPKAIVLSGQLAQCADILLAGINERVHQQTQPLVTSDLEIRVSELGDLAGVTGLAISAADQMLAAAALPALLDRVGAA